MPGVLDESLAETPGSSSQPPRMSAEAESVAITSPADFSRIGVDPVRPSARPPDLACDGRDVVDERKQLDKIVAVPARQSDRQRHTGSVHHQVMLICRFRRNRPAKTQLAPSQRARMLLESTPSHNQAIRRVFERLRSSRCSLSYIPARCHSRSHRQAVTPEQPI